jgi:hypothetical protein
MLFVFILTMKYNLEIEFQRIICFYESLHRISETLHNTK